MKYVRIKNNSRGYTLVEMIVSIGIFSVVMLMATGAYLTIISLDQRTRAQNDLVNSLTFAVDSMSRALRTGSGYICGGTNVNASEDGQGNCPSGDASISFTDENNRKIMYRITNTGQLGRCASDPGNPTLICSSATAIPLTDSRITINTLTYYVQGVGSGDSTQPHVTFVINGSLNLGPKYGTQNFVIQTTSTQRLIEL